MTDLGLNSFLKPEPATAGIPFAVARPQGGTLRPLMRGPAKNPLQAQNPARLAKPPKRDPPKASPVHRIADVLDEAYKIFEDEAKSLGCLLYSFKNDIRDYSHEEQEDGSLSSFKIGSEEFMLKTKLRSFEIGKNFAIATLALKKLNLLDGRAMRAMENLTLEGRFEERKDGKKSQGEKNITQFSKAAP